ncbi:hypothetical protein H1S01_07210 [Heliobacterium chlorum]|uniref:Uncharacterized protein n=1 Tax=Heliobacterium chlorum TaxID=2698 RepID=A0ABR7T2P7_HELCL|nr:hypothetical protein [Heliobacterium chlorum]MBC9784298.1 hypothetical protein [Heliobacterium chlorum]
MDPSEGWTVSATFFHNGLLKSIDYPLSHLPLLRIGGQYIDGWPQAQSYILKIYFDKNVNGDFCLGRELPNQIRKEPLSELIDKEVFWTITYQDIKLFIPCYEIIRAYIGLHRILLDYMLHPGGLNILVRNVKYEDDQMLLELDRLSLKTGTTGLYSHIAWILSEPINENFFNSVCNKMYRRAIFKNPHNFKQELEVGIPFDINPPPVKETLWTIDGIYYGNNLFITRIMNIIGLKIPYENVYVKISDKDTDFIRVKKHDIPIFTKAFYNASIRVLYLFKGWTDDSYVSDYYSWVPEISAAKGSASTDS